jgi:N-acetylmuramoyl-L-alanine amidase
MRIVIDAGHGGKDPGAVGNGLREKDLTLTLAKRIGKLLAARGAEVYYTRDSDVFVELSDRAMFANQLGADYFMSFHINAGGGTGFETFVQTGSSGATVANQNVIHRRVALLYAQEGLPDRGAKQANLAVLRETHMPAILLEYGFIDSAKDAARLADPAWLERLAQATAAGVSAAFGLPDAVPEAKHVVIDEEENIMKLDLTHEGWAALAGSLQKAYDGGLLGDYRFVEKASKGLLTWSELDVANNLILVNGAVTRR